MRIVAHKLDNEDFVNALDSLDEDDRDRILTLAQKLDLEMKSRGPYKVMFGPLSALELLAKLGIFLSREGIDRGMSEN